MLDFERNGVYGCLISPAHRIAVKGKCIMPETEPKPDVTALTVQLLSAYLANNTVASNELADLIRTTRSALTEDPPAASNPAADEHPAPAVTVRKSLASPDHILSLIDGKPYQTLKRHLTRHGLTPETYRKRYNLPDSYPMVAPAFAAKRREIAQKIGLGVKRKPEAESPDAGSQTGVVAEVVGKIEAAAPQTEKAVSKLASTKASSPARSRAKAAPEKAAALTAAKAPAEAQKLTQEKAASPARTRSKSPAAKTPLAKAPRIETAEEKPVAKRAVDTAKRKASGNSSAKKTTKPVADLKPVAAADGAASQVQAAPSEEAKPKGDAGAKAAAATSKAPTRNRTKVVPSGQAKSESAVVDTAKSPPRAKLGLFRSKAVEPAVDAPVPPVEDVVSDDAGAARKAPKAKRMARMPAASPQG
ncbi:MucR family transcriptional regulator [Novosphingobium sp. JCM 18896]|uniref:MucR family transcriptional regulator n=1 Tax=Novosphingobium sp. JCM 18896 TaxID=2989731 RepID=UPI002221EE4C|nr:MucR family transcriptional regulator [Novosphingobium sp. JCM 18896]MCW1432020.1 MucR family transcriptional regulator [Novosphingobium sp. JCM 18896]